jgi:hypothetical protein
MKFTKLLLLLSACALLGGCSKTSNTNNANAPSNTTSTTTTTTTTASPKASVEASKSPAETVSSAEKVSKPEDAAQGLFKAWKTKDRTEAAKFASNIAIKTLFSEGGPEGLQFQGCDKQAGGDYNCSYYYEGGGLIMLVKGNSSDGYQVIGTTFIAD